MQFFGLPRQIIERRGGVARDKQKRPAAAVFARSQIIGW